jgi:beta-lactamase regulating signal transducer with metallopeptidase domain
MSALHILIDRIGWTLLHALWQAAAIAILLLLVRLLLRGRAPETRYVAACVALLATILLSLTTFFMLPAQRSAAPVSLHEAVPDAPFAQLHAPIASPESARLPAPSTTAAFTVDWISTHLHWLVIGWLAGAGMLVLWDLAGWLAVQNLRRVGISPAPPILQDRFDALAADMRVRVPVAILRSSLVSVPLVIGWVRPLILMPIALLGGLSPMQLDAIIAHELAHVRRRDYLVNLMQVLAETLLFYHPAVWWMSAKIREERENCCDDIAASVCGSPLDYAQTLLCLENLTRRIQNVPALAAASARTPSELRRRIERILHRRESKASSSVRILSVAFLGALAVCVLSACVVATSSAQVSTSPQAKQPATQSALLDIKLNECNIENQPLKDVIRLLGDKTGVRLAVNWKALDTADIRPESPVTIRLKNIRLRKALDIVFSVAAGAKPTAAPVIYVAVDAGVVTITRNELVTRTFDIRDLLPADIPQRTRPEFTGEIIAVLKEPIAWTDQCSIREQDGQLIVTQTRRELDKIEGMIEQLRATRSRRVPENARFERKLPADWKAATRPAFLKIPLGHFRASGTPFEKVIDQLRTATGRDIAVAWRTLAKMHVTKVLPITIDLTGLPLDAALTKLLNQIGGTSVLIGFTVDDGIIWVNKADNLDPHMFTKVYDVRNVLAPAGEKRMRDASVSNLIQRIRGLDPLSWRDGGFNVGSVRELSGQLIVTQTPQMHQRIASELRDMAGEHDGRKSTTSP